MKEKIACLSMFLLFAGMLLTGCGVKIPKTIGQNSVIVQKDGSVTAYIVEEFDTKRYQITELEEMAKREIREYCDSHGQDKIRLDSIGFDTEEPQKIRVVFAYASDKDYSEYNRRIFRYGTVGELQGEFLTEISDARALKDPADGTRLDLAALSQKHVLITDEKALIYCPYTVKYASEGVLTDQNGAADTNACEGTVVLILEK